MKTHKKYSIVAILLIAGIALVVPASATLYWDIDTVGSVGSAGSSTSLAFDGSGNPTISYYNYYNSSSTALKCAVKHGNDWSHTSIDEEGKVGTDSSLSFHSGYPAISYRDITNKNLKYAWENATGWYNTTVDEVGDTGHYTSLAFNQTGNPAISYHDQDNLRLKYAWKNGNVWETETIESGVTEYDQGTSLAFDSENRPVIGYSDRIAGNYQLKYAYKEGSNWQTITIDDVDGGKNPSLAFNETSGYPAISYCSYPGFDLKYAWKNESGWHTVTIDNDFANGATSLAFHNSLPAISYYRNGDLGYAWMDGEGWHTMTVDDGNTAYDYVGKSSSLAFTNDGYPAISYLDTTLWDLKYAVGFVPPTTISVTSSPAGATIYLNETATGKVTPFDLTTGITAGTYNVTVILDGYEPGINNSVTVGEHEIVTVDFSLTEIPPEAPVANFTATPLTGTNPLTVQFTDTSIGFCNEWSWDFGDGMGDRSCSSDQNPEHEYTTTGTYNVTLTASNHGASDTETKTNLITVTDPTPTPTQVIHHGGGGGGHSQFAFGDGTGVLLTSSEGKLLRETTFTSSDGIAALTLGQNTIALDGDGEPLPKITIEAINASDVPENLNGAFKFAGMAYQCTPSGATFAPGITLSLTLPADEWDALDEGDVTIRFYDEKTKEWIELPVTVDHENHTITAKITHFSVFGLFTSTGAETTIGQAQPTVTPGVTISTDALPETQGDTTTAPEPTKSAPLVCVPLFALGALAILRKRL